MRDVKFVVERAMKNEICIGESSDNDWYRFANASAMTSDMDPSTLADAKLFYVGAVKYYMRVPDTVPSDSFHESWNKVGGSYIANLGVRVKNECENTESFVKEWEQLLALSWMVSTGCDCCSFAL